MRATFGKMILVAFVAVIGAGQAQADTLSFSFTTVNGDVGNGLLTATPEGTNTQSAEIYFVTGGTMDVTSGVDFGSYTLLGNVPAYGQIAYSGSGPVDFVYDNVVYVPGVPDPFSDTSTSGILFTGNGRDINLFSAPNLFYDNTGYNSALDFAAMSGGASGSIAVPEPSSFALLGLGGIALAIGAYRRRRAAAV